MSESCQEACASPVGTVRVWLDQYVASAEVPGQILDDQVPRRLDTILCIGARPSNLLAELFASSAQEQYDSILAISYEDL